MTWTESSAADAARSIAAEVFDHRSEAEAAARMAPDVRLAMGESGLFAMAVPTEFGGRESALPDLVAAVEIIGAADPSAGWHLSNTLAVPMAASHLSHEACEEIFSGDLRRPFCVSNSPAGTASRLVDGFQLDGDWPFVTGVLEAEWMVLAAQLAGDGHVTPTGLPPVGIFLTRTADVAINHTWAAAAAMRGTGSNGISAKGLLVKESFATSWWAAPRIDRPLYRISLPAMAFITTGAVALGVLDACLTATLQLVGGRLSRADGVAYADKPRIQAAVADAEAALRGLRAGYHAAMGDLWAKAATAVLTPKDEGPAITATFHAIDGARAAVSTLYLAATPQVYAQHNVVERSLRDIFAISVGVEALRPFALHVGRRLLQGG